MRTASVLLVTAAPALLLALAGTACSPDTEVTTARLTLSLPDSTACRPPDGPGRVELVAAGDFPATEDTVEVLTPEGVTAMPIDKFPFATRALTIAFRSDASEDFLAGAIHARSAMDVEDDLLLLPLGRSCLSPDADVEFPSGAAVAPLPGGGYLVAGGLDEGGVEGLRRLVIVPKDESFSRIEALRPGRVGATATRSGDRIVIAGGAEADDLPAEETFEVYDATAGALEPAARLMCTALAGVCRRRDHGATTLADGWVLLVGGVSERGAEPLRTVVAIEPQTGELDEDYAMITRGRRVPNVLTLSDGTVVVAGGFDGTGTYSPTAEVLIAASKTFQTVAPLLPDRSDQALVALSGARMVAIGGRGSLETSATVFLFRGESRVDRVDVPIADLVPLADASAVRLENERILVVGDDDGGTTRAFEVDVGRGTAEELGRPARPTTALVSCDDGAVAELGPTSGAYRRQLLRSSFDNPPDTLVSMDADWLALDVASSYADGPTGLEALVEGAPIEVSSLLFADLTLSPTVTGDYSLVFRGETGTTETFEVSVSEVTSGPCSVARRAGDDVVFTRRGGQVTIEAGMATGQCDLDGLGDRVRVSLRLALGARFRALSISRL